MGKALLDLLGTKYGEGKDAGEITMTNAMMTILAVISAGEHYQQTAVVATTYKYDPDMQENLTVALL